MTDHIHIRRPNPSLTLEVSETLKQSQEPTPVLITHDGCLDKYHHVVIVLAVGIANLVENW